MTIFSGACANTPIRDQFKEINMAIQAFRFAAASTAVLLATMFASPFVYAKCGCVSGGGDAPKATNGVAQTVPSAVDLASNPAWQVYEFEEDGNPYLYLYDRTNSARSMIVAGRVVYRDSVIEILVYRHANQDYQVVRRIDALR
jgi:hypothetical protein